MEFGDVIEDDIFTMATVQCPFMGRHFWGRSLKMVILEWPFGEINYRMAILETSL